MPWYQPPKIKNELELVGALARWEAEVLALEMRFGERLSYGLRMAIVLSMLPKDQQDRLYERGAFQDMKTKRYSCLLPRMNYLPGLRPDAADPGVCASYPR